MKRFLLLIAAISWGAVGFALVTQHIWNMQPCPWCILQRMVYLLIGAFALLGFFFSNHKHLGTAATVFISTAAASGLGMAIYQNVVAANQTSCTFSQAHKFIIATGLNELLPSVFEVTASCADAALAKLAGIPYELASAALFVSLLLLALVAFRKRLPI
jgi:protein dithiol:quinone oxidoreductase